MSLNIGGDDITEFLYVLLERINFPYRDIDLARSYDWNIMEDLKSRLCTLAEVRFLNSYSYMAHPAHSQGDVALNLYDFVVRKPERPTEKYGLRAYDEIILAPMVILAPKYAVFSPSTNLQCLFEPRVVDFDRKWAGLRQNRHSDITEEIIELQTDLVVRTGSLRIVFFP
jgi:actin-related protein 8